MSAMQALLKEHLSEMAAAFYVGIGAFEKGLHNSGRVLQYKKHVSYLHAETGIWP